MISSRFLVLLATLSGLTNAAVLVKKSPLPAYSSITKRVDSSVWEDLGCYTDETAHRRLKGQSFRRDDMTNDLCANFCDGWDYTYAATEYGRECFCGNVLDGGSAAPGQCTMPCAGNSGEVCGDAARMNLLKKKRPVVHLPSYGGWTRQGCFADSREARVVPNSIHIDSLRPETCMDVCFHRGYSVAGLEYGNECWCGTNLDLPATLQQVNDDECWMNCAGHGEYLCGGSDRIELYIDASHAINVAAAPTGWSHLGCYTDDHLRTLPEAATRFITDGMTPAKCVAQCNTLGFSLAGVEYGGECWCGNTIGGVGAPASSGCSMPCTGDASVVCGGPDRLNVYTLDA